MTRLGRRVLPAVGLTALVFVATAVPATAQEQSPTPESVNEGLTLLGTQINLLWVVIGAVLVIFMQAGFALVETGFCRAKHAAHVVSTNFAIFGLGLRRVLPRRLRLRCSAATRRPRSIGLDEAAGERPHRLAATGCSCGRAASPSGRHG